MTYELGNNYDRDGELGDLSKTTYCGEITNNLLVIGQAGSGKTYFVENLLANGFVKGDDLIWISSERLSSKVRDDYHDRFKIFQTFRFYVALSPKDVTGLLQHVLPQIQERFQNEARKTVIVFDDLLNIADKSDEYTRFLANSRHYGVITVNIFQAFRNSVRWDSIKANSQMLALFKLSLQAGRVISQVSNIIIGHYEGISKKESWLYKLFVDVVLNSTQYNHLLIDLRAEADFSASRFRSQADNRYTQLCYFDSGRHNSYTTYRAIRSKKDGTKSRCFQITAIIYKDQPSSRVEIRKRKKSNSSSSDNNNNDSSSCRFETKKRCGSRSHRRHGGSEKEAYASEKAGGARSVVDAEDRVRGTERDSDRDSSSSSSSDSSASRDDDCADSRRWSSRRPRYI